MARNEAELSNQFPIKLFTLALFLTVASFAWFSWKIYDSYTITHAVGKRGFHLQELQGVIIHLDEVLTMSARMAAATGDLQWEQRYRTFEPQLESAIKQAIEFAPYS